MCMVLEHDGMLVILVYTRLVVFRVVKAPTHEMNAKSSYRVLASIANASHGMPWYEYMTSPSAQTGTGWSVAYKARMISISICMAISSWHGMNRVIVLTVLATLRV